MGILQNRTASIIVVSGARLLTLLLQLVTVPVYLRILGEAKYGVNFVLITAVALVGMVDLSIPSGIQYVLSKTAKTSESEFEKHFRTGMTLTLIYGAIAAVIIAFSSGTVSHDPKLAGVTDLPLIFGLAGIASFIGSVSGMFWMPLMAREDFAPVAVFSIVVPLVNTIATLILVVVLKSPLAFGIGMVVDSLLQLLFRLISFRKNGANYSILPGFDKSSFKEIMQTAFKTLLPSICFRLGANADKVAVSVVLGIDYLTIYRFATQIPQIVVELTMKFVDFITPEMTHQAGNEQEKFTPTFLRNFSIAGAVAFSGVLFVSAFGDYIQRVWFKTDYANFGTVCFLMGIYYSFESYHSIITKGFFAKNLMHLTTPFALFNTIVTVFCTPFLARKFGLLGVGWMNALIDLLQIAPFHWMATKYLLTDVSPVRLIGSTLKLFGFALVFCIPVLLVSPSLPSGKLGLLFVPAVPLMSGLLFVAYFRLKLVDIPAGLARILNKVPLMGRLFGVPKTQNSL